MSNRPKINASIRMVSEYCGTTKGSSTQTPAATAKLTFQFTLVLLAEQAAGSDHQNRQHQEVHECEREVLEVVGTEHLHEGDQDAADERAEERAHAADDDDDEGVDDDGRSHAEKRRDQRRGEHAAECGHRAAQPEHAGAHQIDIGAERVDHFRILRHRAYQQAGAGALEELPDRDGRGEPERDQEQPVERKRLAQDDDDAAQEIGNAGAERLGAPDDPDQLAQHDGEPEGEQQIGAAAAPSIEAVQKYPLEHQSNRTNEGRRNDQRQQEASGNGDSGEADIGAEHEDDAVRKIDDAHDA